MRIINKKYLLIILLIGIILTGVIIFKPKETVKLDNVVLKQELNNKTFAMYTETDSGYEEYKENNFPTAYVLNLDKSKCIDNSGNEIENALYTKDNKVGIRSNKSFYCYLYFDKSLGLEIKEKNPQGLSSDKVKGAMYRFQGQTKDEEGNELVDNYICFGTSNKEDCLKDTDHYMYRIIGIEAETGRVKVIKKESLKEYSNWWDNEDDDIEFPDSNIYKTISGEGFLENLTYVPVGWSEKIANNTWMYGDMYGNNTMGASQTGEELYLVETGQKGTIWDTKANEGDEGALPYVVEDKESPYNGKIFYYINHNNEKWTKSFDGKVSLMYLHDYYFSVSDTANCQYYERNYEICKTGWMHLSQNDPIVPNDNEWTMSRLGWSLDDCFFDGYRVGSLGHTIDSRLTSHFYIRPVFYISGSEKLLNKDATGTITDPFIIAN